LTANFSYGELKIFSGRAHPALAQEICDYLDLPVGQLTVYNFSDGENYCQIDENVRGADVFVVQPTGAPVNEHMMELLILLDAFRRSSAARLTAVMPYFGYARQDKKDKPRVPIAAKLMADLLTAAGADRITAPGRKLTAFRPGGHWTRSLLPSPDGRKLYAGVGSFSNIAESGMEVEEGRAAIYELDLADGSSRIFAGGLRNAVGLAWEPQTGVLWTVVNERDGLGDETPPDYLTSVRDGGFYGWPYCYWGQTVDDRVPQDPAAVAKAIRPDYALGGHTASLGLCWLPAGTLPGFPDGMAIGQHGSWNRSTLSGYKVVFVPFANGRPAGPPRDILTGFLAPDERVSYGRPVGVTLGPDGSLLVADDVGDVIWRVTGE